MEYLPLIGTVAILHLFVAISPDPNFFITVRNTLTYSRSIGIWTAVGFSLGLILHISYAFAGIAVLIAKSIFLFNVIKFLGAGYLIYIGIKSLSSKSQKLNITKENKKKHLNAFGAIKIGFLTNALNPKTTLFILSLFTLVIAPDTPSFVVFVMGVIMILNILLWYSLVAIFFSHKRVRSVFEKFQNIFNKTFGGLLIALGIKVALSEK